jgi:hypothetical protein
MRHRGKHRQLPPQQDFPPNFNPADRRRISAPALGNGLNETGRRAIPGANVILSGGSGSS